MKLTARKPRDKVMSTATLVIITFVLAFAIYFKFNKIMEEQKGHSSLQGFVIR